MIRHDTRLRTDVVVIGGGIAGLMAAIRAAEAGAAVVLAEKANTLRSGSGAAGNDHFRCYLPEVHGAGEKAFAEVFKQVVGGHIGAGQDPALARTSLAMSGEIIRLWQTWGIDMKPGGGWDFSGHGIPGKQRISLKYNGKNQKKILTGKALELGVTILNRMPVVELLTRDGVFAGAVGLDVSDKQSGLVLIEAKAGVLATGVTTRLYVPAQSPGDMFNVSHCPACAGGIALAYRAGARLVNMEFSNSWLGPKNFARAGKATWIGVCRYPDGTPVGPFIERSSKDCGDMTLNAWTSSIPDAMAAGTGPVYVDCTDAAAEDLAYQRWGMTTEGLTALLDYMDSERIDLSRHAVMFMQYEPILMGRGVDIDETGQSSLPGLFAAGDAVGNFRNGVPGAAAYGRIAGESAARAVSAVSASPAGPASLVGPDFPEVRALAERYSVFLSRTRGNDWEDANRALQVAMSDFAPAAPKKRSARLLAAGLMTLELLKERLQRTLAVPHVHALMRAQEVFDLFDVGEAVMHAALERRESRGSHVRSDFPYPNPMLEKFLTMTRVNGRVVPEWRNRRLADNLVSGIVS